MQVCYSDQPFQAFDGHSVFLCGPTPRNDITSWRKAALTYLESRGYTGTVYVPERSDWEAKFDYVDQVEWEYVSLHHVNAIACWVPRQRPDMLGLTTNVEFGHFVSSPRFLYGRPEGADSVRYLDWMFGKFRARRGLPGRPEPFSSLEGLLDAAMFWNPIY